MRTFCVSLVCALLSGCVSSSVTPVSGNQIIINTSAAPICRGTGAQNVAVKMAAVETLRRGFQRFVIVGMDADNNVGSYRTGPTYATTTMQTYGNTAYGNTTFGGGSTVIYGTHDASLAVVLLNPGDAEFREGVDAKATLGEKWPELVKNGISTCG